VPAPVLEEHPQRRQDDGDQDVHAVGRPLRHPRCCCCFLLLLSPA
jgi:hypothetical protein